MDKEVKELKKELKELILKVQLLEDDLNKLKKGELGTGVYLEGCPEYAQDYIVKKEGE